MIARIWRGITHVDSADAYLDQLRATALPALAGQPGQRGAWVLRRVQGERCEFQVISLWDSLDAVRAWTGGDPNRAMYYAEDDKYLLDMEPVVRHYDVADTLVPAAG